MYLILIVCSFVFEFERIYGTHQPGTAGATSIDARRAKEKMPELQQHGGLHQGSPRRNQAFTGKFYHSKICCSNFLNLSHVQDLTNDLQM